MKNAIMGIFLKKIKRDEKCHYGHFSFSYIRQ